MMKKILLALCASASICYINAQQKDVLEPFKNMNMRSIGPATTSGRVTAIDVQEGNENIIYAGAASGGLWKSENGGVEWTPIFDKQDVLGIGSVCIDPSNPDVIWAGTGEGNPRNSQTSGNGMYKSLDGGRTWKMSGLQNTHTIHRVMVNPQNSNIVYAGVHGSAWGPTKERGVYRTSNGGESWDKILFINDTTGCADLVMDPQNPNKLFAAMYQYWRRPWYFTSGGKGSGLHMTLDGGKTWTQLTDKNGLPEGELGRIGLAISHSNPKVVYALIESKKTGLYKSTDGGFNWKLVTTEQVSDRPFYYHELYVDPQNENHLIYLHSTVTESIDGGKTWTTLLPYYGVHPDHHAMWWSKTNPKYMIEGNDGGLNISHDGGTTWTFAGNLPLGQFYHINYDMDTPYHVYGGMQDNGSWKGPGYVWHGGGIGDADWQELYFGDGFDVAADPKNSRYVYAMSQGGELAHIDTHSGESQYIKPAHPEGKPLRFHWNSGLAIDPFNDCGLYFGSQYLHHSTDCGMSWQIMSPDLSTNDTTKQKQATTGGLTIDNTSAEIHCTILCIAPSVLDKNVIWVGTDDGNIQLTTDGGKSWINCSPLIAQIPKAAWVSQIVASTYKAGEAFVVVNNYRQNDWKPYLFYTNDYGKTWKNMVDEKRVSGHCLSVVQDQVEPKLIFLGTENGLYISFDFGNTWNKWMHDYPSVATQDLKIHPRENDLIIGTFGRAAYVLDNITPLRKFAQEGGQWMDKKLTALHTPDAYMSNYLQPVGQRFPADGKYAGENKQGGAVLSFYYKADEEKKADEKKKEESGKKKNGEEKKKEELAKASDKNETGNNKKDNSTAKSDTDTKSTIDKKVTAWIMTLNGDTLRTLKAEQDTGINHINWYFDTKGIRFPQRRERKPEDTENERGGGPQVAPGTYKVVFKYNEWKDSTTFKVLADPRVTFNEVADNKQRDLVRRLNKAVQTADDGMEQLKAAKKTITLVKDALVNVPDSMKKDLISKADSLTKNIATLQELYFLPEDAAGYRDDSHLLNSKFYFASGLVNTGSAMPGTNAEHAVQAAEKQTRDVADKINLFFEKDYAPWRTQVEKMQFSLFKEVKKL
ncbi:MAG: WD40/YVTN/BNR-like repeat-containing protein [Flavobacteriales bacterium]